MENQVIRDNFPQLPVMVAGQTNIKLAGTELHRNDLADQDFVPEITQWHRSRRIDRSQIAGRPRVGSPESLRRYALTKCQLRVMETTTDVPSTQTSANNPVPIRVRADPAGLGLTEPLGLAGFLQNEGAAVVTEEHIKKWKKERASRHLLEERKKLKANLRHYGTMAVPNCMRARLEHRTPHAKTLNMLYQYYCRDILEPIKLYHIEAFPKIRCRFGPILRPQGSKSTFIRRMSRLKVEIQQVWEQNGCPGEDEDTDTGAEKDSVLDVPFIANQWRDLSPHKFSPRTPGTRPNTIHRRVDSLVDMPRRLQELEEMAVALELELLSKPQVTELEMQLLVESETNPGVYLDLAMDLYKKMEAELETELEAGLEAELETELETELEAELEAELETALEADLETDLERSREKYLEPEPTMKVSNPPRNDHPSGIRSRIWRRLRRTVEAKEKNKAKKSAKSHKKEQG
ncbi:hypothetical protein AOQ84DRAFT_227799 [Glonium stellatum]|uniref:Uncharacterized protein n=1 Tax=Glonium stellatum TaxID=574774 RepID=A0A8E2F8A5_9PEZI|nr:hypothetical protein AOQ84DRAFT_227799 [Glonium stellatum]